jgi:hypothetical protein
VNDPSPQCPPVPGSERYQQLTDLVNAVVLAYDIVLAECVSFEADVDAQCANEFAYNALNQYLAENPDDMDTDAWREIIEDAFLEAIGDCGLQCNVDGSFSNAQYEATILAMRESAVLDVTDNVNADIAASQADNSTGSLAIIAGGAGGGLVLIIIVIVIVMRRGKNSDSDGKDDVQREVVAFENPMYDTPDNDTVAVYEDQGDDLEALYDEPAFAEGNATVQNPLYQSTDDLTAEEEEEGGYLDVAGMEEDE